ncbi:MAG: hypothetical protein LCH26_01375 [Proteobacteria bacterium]|nr:hypothetical protein [Pseudomonadota bacterium]
MKKLRFLFVLPFLFSAPCHGSSKDVCEIPHDKEYGSVRTLAAHKFTLDFVSKYAPGAQSWEEALEGIFKSSGAFGGMSHEALLDHTRAWLADRKSDDSVGEREKERLHLMTTDDISPELHQKIYQFSKAQNVLRAAFEAQWDMWMQNLGSQEPGQFTGAFVTAYPDALPQQLEDFAFFRWNCFFKECNPCLKPYALLVTSLCASLEGIEDVHHIVTQDIAWEPDLPYSPQAKGEHLKAIGAFENLRSLAISRDGSYFTKRGAPCSLLETLKEILPKLTRLETLQLPVLAEDEEAQAMDLLSGCGHIKRVILSTFTHAHPGDQTVSMLNPRPLFDTVPENVETYLREDDGRRGGIWSNVPLYGGIYPYTAHNTSCVNIAPNLSFLSNRLVNAALVTMVIPQEQNQ